MLADGATHSVIEIAMRLRIADPRSEIRNLRNKGVNVLDYWEAGRDGKYKRYYIPR